MSGRGRGRRGGGGPRRGPPRGMQQPRRNNFRRPPQRDFQEITSLGSEEVICDSKKINIEFNSNEQGQFMKISEADGKKRRVIVNMESARMMKDCLDEIAAKDFPSELPAPKIDEMDRIDRTSKLHHECTPFNHRNRRYTVSVRSNERGFFVKLSVQTGWSTYIAFPLEKHAEFREKFTKLFEQYFNPQDNESPAPASPTNLPSSREVRAGGKSFYFDVEKNDRGTFVRLTEVVRNYGRRTHINIPNSCWPQMSEVFSQLGQELPYEEGNGSLSGSEDN